MSDESMQRMLHAQQANLERSGERLRRIANLLYGPAHAEGASDEVVRAYAIAREAR